MVVCTSVLREALEGQKGEKLGGGQQLGSWAAGAGGVQGAGGWKQQGHWGVLRAADQVVGIRVTGGGGHSGDEHG